MPSFSVALLPAGFSERFLDFSAAVIIIDRSRRSNRNQRTLIILHYIWQPLLALLGRFLSPENERPNLRSRRLTVPCESEFTLAGNFQTKDSDFALEFFKQRI